MGSKGVCDMVARITKIGCLLVALLLAWPAAAEERPLRMGLMPTNAALSLLNLYHPMALHVQNALGRPVEVFVSRTFRVYYDELVSEQFDFIVPAPHLGVIALDHNYEPLFRYQPELRPIIVMAKNSGIRNGAQLKGRRVLTADRMTAVSVVAERWLEVDFGLQVGRDYQLVEASNHTSAIRAVALGDADAAITTPPALIQVPPEVRNAVDTMSSRLAVPQQFAMVHRRLGHDTVERIRAALSQFPETPDGRAFFAKGYGGFIPLSKADVELARPYAEMVVRRIQSIE
jgi:phosphonate transport system substrate-binding protein